MCYETVKFKGNKRGDKRSLLFGKRSVLGRADLFMCHFRWPPLLNLVKMLRNEKIKCYFCNKFLELDEAN